MQIVTPKGCYKSFVDAAAAAASKGLALACLAAQLPLGRAWRRSGTQPSPAATAYVDSLREEFELEQLWERGGSALCDSGRCRVRVPTSVQDTEVQPRAESARVQAE